MDGGLVRVGLLGCGVVGTGIVEVMQKKRAELLKRTGFDVRLERIAVCDVERNRHQAVDTDMLTNRPFDICTDAAIDLVIEVIGGTDTAREAVLAALSSGKPVVTANKELVARYGDELRRTALQNHVQFRYEASALAGVPVIHPLETYFTVNRIEGVRGIVNGTCNYVLTRMSDEGMELREALLEAQQLGYAEHDPSMDIDGQDARFKLDILLDTFGFSKRKCVWRGSVQGIRHVSSADVQSAKVKGRKLKHVAQAVRDPDTNLVVCKIGVEALSQEDPLYSIDGVQNALNIRADIVGDITLVGPGAGALPTASAVLEDVIQILLDSCDNSPRDQFMLGSSKGFSTSV